jgi:2-oxoisovalerate dehydrogenase E1 component
MQEQEIMTQIDSKILLKAYELMCTAREMAAIYDENRQITKYVHSTSKGHEALQLALAFQLKTYDWVGPYYRDESILLGLGYSPYQLMLQLLAKKDDPFSGGRSYYSHPSSNAPDKPKIPHQSSATGMQAIPMTGVAQGIHYKEATGLSNENEKPVVVCSFGDGSITEGEVAEAFQFAVLKGLPILYFVQDNDWGISVSGDEARAMNAYEYAAGFKGMKRMDVDGSDFIASYEAIETAIDYIRKKRKPVLLHAKVPLLGHHTSGVRKEWYRTAEDIALHQLNDPFPKLEKALKNAGIDDNKLESIKKETARKVRIDFEQAVNAAEPDIKTVHDHVFAPTSITEEKGNRQPEGREKVVMVDAALHAVREILEKNPDALLYGQDVGRRLGGVFREAATLAEKFGDDRVFNTAIQEAYIIGSTNGMSATGLKPIVEVQFADYIWPGLNQLVTELSKSCYLTMGKFPVQALIRVPIGAYGSGGPYHSGCVESSVLAVKGIKVCYPSNAADMKGLMKAAFYDPNPVVMFEHKGLYWSKVPGTDAAKTIEPDENYMIPLGKANVYQEAETEKIENGESLCIITYGMGVHWALNASKAFPGQVEILDLRTLSPLDEDAIYSAVKKHNKCIVLTEETLNNSFAQTIAARISEHCFTDLDAPVRTIGAMNNPAVPLNTNLEKAMLPNENIVKEHIRELLDY